jgi:hypothetical protein
VKRRPEPAADEESMPEHLRAFRREDWPEAQDGMTAGIHFLYARVTWRHAHGLPAWRRSRVVDR